MKRVGLIGCGAISETHIWALGWQKYIEVVALSDCKTDKACELAKKYQETTKKESQSIHIYGDYLEMLDQEALDVVHICTPHYLHVPMAMEALKRGISVFMEKPPAITMEQFVALQEVAVKSKARIGICFQNRYNETIAVADEIVKSEVLGKVIGGRAFVTWRRDANYYDSEWKGQLAKEGGGVLINQSIHTLDLLLRYFEEPISVQALVGNHHLKNQVEVEDTVEAWMEFPEGQRACFFATTAYVSDASNIMELQCEKGSIQIKDHSVIVTEENKTPQVINCKEGTGIGKSYWGAGHRACIRDFYRCISNGKPFQNDLLGVEKTMRTVMKIYDFRK